MKSTYMTRLDSSLKKPSVLYTQTFSKKQIEIFSITVLLHDSISFALQRNAVAKNIVDKIARVTLLFATCLALKTELQIVGKVD